MSAHQCAGPVSGRSPDPSSPEPGSPDPGSAGHSIPDPGSAGHSSPDPGSAGHSSPDLGSAGHSSPDPGGPDPGSAVHGSPEPGSAGHSSPDPGSPGRRKRRPRQLFYQVIAAVLLNGYIAGFAYGRIFTGKSKALCVPVLNCYSCPGALGSCPVGALQAEYGHRTFPFYALGTLTVFGVLLGRLVCGLICPFGLVQDLLHRIPLRKWNTDNAADRAGRKLKYVVLAVTLVILPVIGLFGSGVIPPYFCKYICPAGTLEGGIPLMIADPRLRALAGALFDWKVFVLAAVVFLSIKIHRPFCRYLCPLGAFYSLFNRFSFYQMSVDSGACVGCGKCREVCPMGIDVTEDANSPECIRCGRCRAECPASAIAGGFRQRGIEEETDA